MGCGCGDEYKASHCGCGCHHNIEEEIQTVTITLEDNTNVECDILGTFDVDDKEYITLLPIGDDEVLIYRYTENDGEVSLDLIESDEEFAKVSEVFYSLFQDECEEGNSEE